MPAAARTSSYKPPKKPRSKAGTKLAKTAIKHRLTIHGKHNTTSAVHLWHLQVQTNNNLQRIKARAAKLQQKAAA